MSETRRASDTIPISRAEIDEALRAPSQAPPPSLQAELARAQGLGDVEICCLCHVGIVEAKLNARARLALPPPPPPETADDLPEEETQP